MNPLTWIALGVIAWALAYGALRRGLLSLTLSVAIVAVYLLEVASVEFVPGQMPVAQELAWTHLPGVYVSPPWTFVTTIFVHAGLTHLFFNLLGFLLITPLLEERIGTLRWALVFFLGAFFGQILFFVARLAMGTADFVLLGASGGLMAVLGAFARLYPRERFTLFLPLPGVPTIPAIWFAIGFLLLSFVFVGTGGGGVAHEAHIGGLAFGFAAIPLIMKVPARRAAKVEPLDLAALGGLATTRELREILDELRAADVTDVRTAWLEKFAAKAACPKCSGPLRYRRGTLSSACGWRLRP